MNVPRDLRYTKTHEWVRIVDGLAVVGITDFAQEQLSDITFVELPPVGEDLGAEDQAAVVESVKAASDIYSPLQGSVVEVNDALNQNPDVINTEPYGAGWIFKMRPDNPADAGLLLNASEYEELLPEEQE